MNLYTVLIRTVAIISAETEADARNLAREHRREILRDDSDPGIDVGMRIRSITDARNNGWDEDRIPYGGDGNTSIKDLLTSL